MNLFAKILLCAAVLSSVLHADLAGLQKYHHGKYGPWTPDITGRQLPTELLAKQGPNGGDAIRIRPQQQFKLSIPGLTLTAGRKYRFGAYVRTAGLKSRVSYLVIHNAKWRKHLRTGSLPADTKGKWVRLEATDVLPESADGKYTFAVYARQIAEGAVCDVSSPFIEELSADGTPVPKKKAEKEAAADVSLGEQLQVARYSFTAKTITGDKSSLANSDPNFKKLTDGVSLTDGIHERSGRSVLWRHIQNQEKPVVIRLDFMDPVRISTARIHFFRWKRSYGIKDITLVALENGKRIPLGKAVLNHPYEKPEKDPYYMTADIASDNSVTTRTAELIFRATGGYLSLNELEFFGKKVSVPQEKQAAAAVHPLEKVLTSQKSAGLRLYEKDGMYVMENDYSIYVIDPRFTGAVNLAYDRIGKRNMILYADLGKTYGPIYLDRFYPGDYALRDMYLHMPYKPEIIASKGDRIQLRLTGTGRSGIFRNVTIEKNYILTSHASNLKTDFVITNGMDNVAPLKYGYWMCGGSQSPDGYMMLFPGSYDVEKIPHIRQFAMRDISSGWMASYANSGDQGLALTMPYELLKEFYIWNESKFRGTVEYKLGIYPIKAGDSLRFSTSICPFSGIGMPDKVTELAAASFGDPLRSPVLKFRFFSPGDYALKLSGGWLKGEKITFREMLRQPLKKGLFAEIPYRLPDGQGTFVLKAELLQQDRTVFFAEKSCIRGTLTGTWTLTPDGPRKPDLADSQGKLNLDFHSLKEETPHIKWGKPYSGGRPKVLALNKYLLGIREMVELAQRFDFDLTTNYIAGLWSLSGHVMSLNTRDCIKQITEKLKTKYDVIIVSGDLWKDLPANITMTLLSQVEKGAGLILTAPEGHPEPLRKLFRQAESGFCLKGSWTPAPDNPLTAGIPFAALPPTRAFRYSGNGGNLLATVKDAPLLAEYSHGKGKVILAAWCVQRPRRRDVRPSSGFLPCMSYDDPGLSWHYWEYQSMLFGRMIYRAAGRASGIQVNNSRIQNGSLQLKLDTVDSLTADVQVTIRNKFSESEKILHRQVRLAPGAGEITIPLPAVSMQGRHFAEIIISTAKGKAWWGTETWLNQTAAEIKTCNLPGSIFQQDGEVPVKVDFLGEGRITSRLIDNHGNVFAQGEGSECRLPLKHCLTAAFRLVIELDRNGTVIDRMVKRLYIFRKPDPRRFQIAQGWPSVSQKAPLWLMSHYVNMLKKYGVTGTSGSGSSWDVTPVEYAFRENDVLFLSIDTYNTAVGGKYPFDRKKKPRTKFDLIRTPCLSDPAVLKAIRSTRTHIHPGASKYGAILVAGADEANMFSHWDGCFSEHCMREFRKYMKETYGTLEALNRSWQTAFKTWEEVVPMTLDEVRAHGSYAPWMDHRTFNDRQRARAFAAQVDGIHQVDPQLALSLSGTSETNPWNAWDYYQIMPVMQAMAGYGGEQTIQQRSFCPVRLFSMPWIGYDVGYDDHNAQVMNYLLEGCTGFNIYGGNFYFTPDWTVPRLGQELIQVLDRYKNGKADVIRSFTPFSYPVAFHYSPASIKVDFLENLDGERKNATRGFKTILEDNSLNYSYLAYGELERKIFKNNRILFLPVSMALSDKEIQGLKSFVQNGGILVADYGTGHFDQHGVRRPHRKELLEIFGLRQFGSLKAEKALLTGASGALQGLKMQVNVHEAGLVPDTAESLGTVQGSGQAHPAVLVNRLGKGRAVYLATNANGILGTQAEIRFNGSNKKNTQLLTDFFRSLFAAREIRPLATAPTLRSTSIKLMSQNSCYILGLLRDISQTMNLETKSSPHVIHLQQPYHIWDLVGGKYLGRGKSFSYDFAPNTQSMFILLPYKPEKLTAAARSTGPRSFHIDAQLQASGQKILAGHIFRMVLKTPDGTVNPSYTKLLDAVDGKARTSVHLPLNMPARGWTLELTDVITGLQTGIPLQ